MNYDLTEGPVLKTMLKFAVPMILGNLLQQCYNIADTLIVGRFLGADALAAVGSAFTLMTFLTSILLGLCMGSSTVFSIYYGQKNSKRLRDSVGTSFLLIGGIALLLTLASFAFLEEILLFLQVPKTIQGLMREYLRVIFLGIAASFFYNYFSSFLRALGNSIVPLIFLACSAVLNIGLDLWFVIGLSRGTAGAAEATVISQYISGIGILIYTWIKFPEIRRALFRFQPASLKEIANFSFLTCIQQSVMNLGILMVQGLVNSFGTTIMAAFAAAVKIDSFAYMPVQDFGNAFSTFIAQNYGAKKKERIRQGLRGALLSAMIFCFIISILIWIFAKPLMLLFIKPHETAILAEGIRYLHIEGSFYCGIGCLFLLYGLYRALGKPEMSLVLTIISLGTRVFLAYQLSAIPFFGVVGIWWSVPIGWFLADLAGILYYLTARRRTELF
ncbi:MAG TPA: MATE family efflux transporter [Candidatus Anaerostipes excrementavium]|uniref:Probable multidrug resistance protein NorM n=1 Tax=Candidatus Anaerostipes excrementavium TaxID=2838463 RepID=A0A9D1WTT3_9FIRM|nr:MATE family efflux transporter [uncultured Anaerostipes sp.]HIX66675.1 MATE family efflux transporter [Candidatus Anaerostipes excrementavium]